MEMHAIQFKQASISSGCRVGDLEKGRSGSTPWRSYPVNLTHNARCRHVPGHVEVPPKSPVTGNRPVRGHCWICPASYILSDALPFTGPATQLRARASKSLARARLLGWSPGQLTPTVTTHHLRLPPW